MVYRILSVIDSLTGIFMLVPESIPVQILTASSLYLIAKGLLFSLQGDKISILDFLAGVYMIFVILNFSNIIISIFFAIFLIQKILWCFK